MNVLGSKPPQPVTPGGAAQSPDPRLTPTPDYGTLGPDSDFEKSPVGSSPAMPASPTAAGSRSPASGRQPMLQIVAMLAGMAAALVVWGTGKKSANTFSPSKKSVNRSTTTVKKEPDRQEPQGQAEILLARAVRRNDGATDEIQSRVESWRGKIKWDSQLSELTTIALNSNDQSVRTSGIEVQLAAYGLAKSEATVDGLVQQAQSTDHAQKIWALWSLGLLGNRGVESDRVVKVLGSHLKGSARDADEESRHWAVEGLALVGTSDTIAPLLDAMHNDPSPMVRERAACSLAESGMLTHEQRLTAVPQLINYSDDPALDARTHAWAFQALADITKQRLPNDSAAWRSWYQTSMVSAQ